MIEIGKRKFTDSEVQIKMQIFSLWLDRTGIKKVKTNRFYTLYGF